MATNYESSDSDWDDTFFEQESHRDENLREVIADFNQGRRERLQAIDRERARSFAGFRKGDRPSRQSLSWLAQNRNTHGLLVSDTRNDPNYTGETLPTVNNEQRQITAQNRSNRSNTGLPLTSTLRRGGVVNLPSAYNESPIVHVRTINQPYNPGVRNQTAVNQHVTNSIRVERNENIIAEEIPLQNVSRQAVFGNGQTPVLQRSSEEQLQTPPRSLSNGDHAEEEVSMRQANIVNNNMANTDEEGEDAQLPGINTNENQREDIGDYRRYFARKIRTDAKTCYERLRRAVYSIQKCEQEILRALRDKRIDCFNELLAEFEGRLELIKEVRNKLEPLITQIEDTVMSEYLFDIDNEIPTWKRIENKLKYEIKLKLRENREKLKDSREHGMAQALHQIANSNQNRYKHKPVNMGTSEFPKFDGKINFYHWWAKWSHLAKVSKLGEENLEVKLKESLVDEAEALMGKTLMATGSFTQICNKLQSIYDKPIQRVQEVAEDFFETYNRKKSSSTTEHRKFIADIEDVLLRVSSEGLSAESLIMNMAVQKLPEHLKRSVQSELSRLQPNFHLTKENYCRALDIVTNRLDRKDEGKVVTSYNSVAKRNSNNSGKEKNIINNEPTTRNDETIKTKMNSTKVSNETNKTNNGKMENKLYYCSIHLQKESECDLDTPKKVRDYLEKHDRCIRCGVHKRNHEDRCRRMYPCHKHYYEKLYHLPRTCEGGPYKHPGCQFNFNR